MSVPPRATLPLGVEPLRISTPRVELAALEAGDRRDETVLLVPGFTGSKEDFLPILAPLAQAGLHVLAIDQRGQFESAGWGRDGDYSLDSFAGDTVSVIDSLDGPVHLVGHSFGGLVAGQAAMQRAPVIGTLTLMDSGPGALPPEHWSLLDALIAMVPVAGLDQIWAAKIELDRQQGAPPLPPDIAEFLRHRWVTNDAWSMSGIAQILRDTADPTDELAGILTEHSIPALVMYGEWDETAWRIPDIAAMGARLSADVLEVPGAAHSPAIENPTATAEAVIALVTQQRT